MKAISKWAKANKWKTIGVLVPLHLILGIFYLFAGVFLYAYEITFPKEVVYIGAGLMILAWGCYPFNHVKKGFYKNTYFKRKLWQGVTLLATAVFITNAGNQLARSSMIISSSESFITAPVVLNFKKINKKPTRKERRLSRKALKKEFRAMVKEFRKSRKENGVVLAQIFLGMLTLFLAVGAAYLVLLASCNLSCSGQEGVALIVLIGGASLIIWGIIAAFRSIIRMGDKPKKPKVQPD